MYKLQSQYALEKGCISWQAPSNIALIKYWGKEKGIQIPMNASLSFSLKKACTRTRLQYEYKKADGKIEFDFTFEGKPKPQFEKKLHQVFERWRELIPALTNYRLKIDSENSFPHSSGMASSASSMAALALCLASLEVVRTKKQEFKLSQVSDWARLGSGSASRSLYAGWVSWGEHAKIEASSQLSALPLQEDKIHSQFSDVCDSILIVESSSKPVSSSLGHQLMQEHVYRRQRCQNAVTHLSQLLNGIQQGDWDLVGPIIEREALELHYLMMTSETPYSLMKAQSLEIIQRVWDYRKSTGVPVYFTLDAGPNVHLIYPKSSQNRVLAWIEDSLQGLTEKQSVFHDEIGGGPLELNLK